MQVHPATAKAAEACIVNKGSQTSKDGLSSSRLSGRNFNHNMYCSGLSHTVLNDRNSDTSMINGRVDRLALVMETAAFKIRRRIFARWENSSEAKIDSIKDLVNPERVLLRK